MRKPLLFSLLFFVFLFLSTQSVNARITPVQAVESLSGSVVCVPGVEKGIPTDCLPLGPAEYLAQVAAQGIPYPSIPLPVYSPNRDLADIQYQYFKVIDKGASLFSSLEAAASNSPSLVLFPSSNLYVSYSGNAEQVGQDFYYPLRSGYWVLADGGRLAMFNPQFQGLLFSSTPNNAFGWVLEETRSRPIPGLNSPKSGTLRNRYQVVQIFSAKEVDNIIWDLVGPDEWIESGKIARVDPIPIPPAGVRGDRWISVNLFEQTIAVYQDSHLVFATLASTGIDHFWTRPGLFQIQRKKESETMSNSVKDDFYYLEDVPWTMYFDEGRALHGAYWHNRFGYPHSHGCVNLSLGDSHWLFNWASEGDFVYIYDPSGKTPTDPSLFGNGAP